MDTEKIKDFLNSSRYSTFDFRYNDKSQSIKLFNNNGFEIDRENVLLLIEGLRNEYENMSDKEKEKSKRNNAENEYFWYQSTYGPTSLKKKFRTNLKRNWGFTCASCGTKVSSKKDKHWWRIYGAGGEYDNNDKYCSETCIMPIVNKLEEEIKLEVYKKYNLI